MADPGVPWDPDDDWVESDLARTRARRARVAQLMLVVLFAPLAAQAIFVSLGAADRWGVIVVALPAVVAWIVVRGRR